MPIYNIQGPDGRIYSLEGPEGATEDQVINALKSNLSSQGLGSLPSAPAMPAPPVEGGFIPSVRRGFAQTGILLGDILPAMVGRAIGANEYAERQFKEAAETQKEIEEKYPAAIPSYKDIKGVGDAITYAVESVGEMVPSILPSLFTGGAAGVIGRGAVIAAKEAAETAARKQIAEKGIQALTEKEVMDQIRKAGLDAASKTALKYEAVGAVTGSAAQNVPEVYQNIKDETQQESLGAALLFGGLNSLLDAAMPLSLLAKARKAGVPGEEIIGAWYKRFGVGAAKGFATEGATEAAQEMSSAAAEKFVDNNIDFFSEKNLERFINAGLKGGLGGGVVSGTTDVMLGKKSLTEDLKPLDEDIRNTQSDILARRALLDELRAQADEEGRNKLDADALKDLGFGTKYSLYQSLLDKDINDPAQAQEVVNTLETAINAPDTKGRERVVANNALEVINQYLSTRGEPDVGQVVEEPSGAGAPVPTEPVTPAPAEGVAGVEPSGVVPPVADVGVPVGGEGLAAAPVTAPVTAPVEAPVETPQAAPELQAPAAPAPAPAETPPTTRELITQQETELAKQMEKFQGLLTQQVQRFGLKDIAVQVATDLKDADGLYTKGLIKLAVDAADPVRALRHESIHALKELGFFKPTQWDALIRQAESSWINTYMRNRNVDGGFIEPGQTSRYDAYIDLFKKQGLTDEQIRESMIEEAIADAFGDFNQTKAPPGMMNAILIRMKNFFQAMKEAVGLSGASPETIFGRIEKAELPAPKPAPEPVKQEAPQEKVEAKAEEKPAEEAPKAEEVTPAKASLRGEVPLSTRTVMESNDDFARAELGLNVQPKRGIANKVRDIGIALNEQTKREQGQMDRQKLTLDNEISIAKAIADEVAYQLTAGQRKTGTGLGWYSNNYPRAVKRLGDRFPELATNRHARSVFTALVAVTSNGEKVNKNIDNAITLYSKLRDGKPMFAMGNRRATALVNNLQVIQDLLAKHGTDFEKVLLQEITVKDMNAQLRAMGQKADTSYLATTTVPAAAVYFGPKLGAFYANLSGSEGYLTMDLWWTRSINRMRGLLLPKATDASIEKLREMIGDPSMTREDLVAATVPLRNKYEEFGYTTELEHLVKKKEPSTKGAKPAWFAQAKRVAGPAYDQLLYDHNLEKMANTIYKNEFEGLEEAPFTANDRAFMYRAGRRAQNLLRSEGIDLTLADIQAALWYYEKRLYEKLSGKKADDIGYEEAILSQADKADRREGPSVVFPERDGRGDVARGEVAGATEVRAEPAEARPEEVTPPKFSISGPRLTPELRQAAQGSAIVDAEGNLIPMYHGTAVDITTFRGKQAGAIFVTPDPEFASGFAKNSRKWMVRHPEQFITKPEIRQAIQKLRQAIYAEYGKQSRVTKQFMEEIGEVLDDAKETGAYNFKGELGDKWFEIASDMLPDGENVMPLYVFAKKPFDYENKADVNRVVKQLASDPEVRKELGSKAKPEGAPENFMLARMLEKTKDEYEADIRDKYRDDILNGKWEVIESPEVQRAIKASDFDSFYVMEGVKNLAVYDPRLIKSATGNVGVFGQRAPTEEEAATLGMEPAEALKAQEEGDIRFSLRAPQAEAFKRWFGDSKVVDANGEPLVVYHGTGFDFNVFEGARKGTEKAYFFTADSELAGSFANTSAGVYEGSANIMPVYLRMKNPLVIDYKGGLKWGNDRLMRQALDRVWAGEYDGVIGKNVVDGHGSQTTIYAVIAPEQIKSATGNIGSFEPTSPDIRFSLRSQMDPAIVARILQTTTAREEKGFVDRITDAIGPESRSRFRAAALNRYNRLGEYDKLKLKRMGGAELFADATAESAALVSDLAAGIVAGALGVYDKVGGVPVYNRHYVVERKVQGPRGIQFVQVGGKIQSRMAAQALAKRFPDAMVKERGFTAVSNLNNTIKGPLAIFAPLAKLGDPDAYRAYQYWAGVKRGSKWMTNPNGQVVEKLFEPADIPKAEKLRQDFLKRGVDFENIQKEWIAYNDQLVQYALDTGVISQRNADKFREHGDYLPFYRQINGDDDAVGPRIFQSVSSVKAPRKIKGGEDPLGDFLENVVRNTQATVQAGMKNVAARRAADVGMDVGTVHQIAQAKATPLNSFYVLENGEKVFYDSADMLFIESIKSLGVSEFPGIGLLSGPAGVLRNLVTKDPGFMLANMMRDSMSAWATSGVDMAPIAATLKNFTEVMAGASPEFRALQMSGVVGGYDYSQGTKDAAKEFGKELRKAAGTKTIGEKVFTPFTSVWDGLERGTQASDAATRIEIYKKTLKETGNEAEALFRALEVMNFNRKGNNAIVRVATAAVPFLNARMQGLDVLYRAGFGTNTTSNAKAIQKAFWVRGMYMAALSSIYWMLTHDDDDYKKQEQETKDNNWLIPSAGIKIPIPFEVGVLFKVIPERITALAFGDDTARDFATSMGRNLFNTVFANPIPQTIVPLVEATTNFSFFTMRPIVGQGLEGVAPAYQVGPGTSRLAEALGKSTNISPMKIDQIIQGYTGTIGSYMSQLIDSIYDMHTDNPKASLRFEQMPVVKRFLLDPDARGQVTAYFDLKNSVDEATRTANLLERSMNFEEWGKYYSQNIGLFAVKDYILDLDKTLKEYRDMKNMVRSLPMGADEKRDSILAITRLENQLNSNIQLLKKSVGK